MRVQWAALACVALPVMAAAQDTRLHYTARLRGIPLLDIAYCLHLEPTAYTAVLTARTVGLVDLLVHGRVDGRAEGTRAAATMTPVRYTEHGRISGETYDLLITYPAGNPVVQKITPPAEKYRTPVVAADLPGAIDGMSAIALETLVVTRTNACQGSALVFDGRQLRRLTTHTAGQDTLPRSGRSMFSGPALRCDTQSVMLAGFLKGQPEARQARPRFSKAWLAPVLPGGPALPVRFAFDADLMGDIVVDLDAVAADCAAGP